MYGVARSYDSGADEYTGTSVVVSACAAVANDDYVNYSVDSGCCEVIVTCSTYASEYVSGESVDAGADSRYGSVYSRKVWAWGE